MNNSFFDILTGAWKFQILLTSVENETLPPRIRRALDHVFPHPVNSPHMVKQMKRMAEYWKALPAKGEIPLASLEDHGIYMEAQDEKARFSMDSFLAQLDLKGVRRLLDVGGGTAPYLRGIQKKLPEIETVYMDIEDAAALAREKGLQGEIITGDIRELDWGKGYNLLLLSHVIHMYDDDTVKTLFRKAGDALAEGGRLVIVEHFIDPQDDPYNFLFDINMLLGTQGGKCRTRQEVKDLAENFLPEKEYLIDPRTGVLEFRLCIKSNIEL